MLGYNFCNFANIVNLIALYVTTRKNESKNVSASTSLDIIRAYELLFILVNRPKFRTKTQHCARRVTGAHGTMSTYNMNRRTQGNRDLLKIENGADLGESVRDYPIINDFIFFLIDD